MADKREADGFSKVVADVEDSVAFEIEEGRATVEMDPEVIPFVGRAGS